MLVNGVTVLSVQKCLRLEIFWGSSFCVSELTPTVIYNCDPLAEWDIGVPKFFEISEIFVSAKKILKNRIFFVTTNFWNFCGAWMRRVPTCRVPNLSSKLAVVLETQPVLFARFLPKMPKIAKSRKLSPNWNNSKSARAIWPKFGLWTVDRV